MEERHRNKQLEHQVDKLEEDIHFLDKDKEHLKERYKKDLDTQHQFDTMRAEIRERDQKITHQRELYEEQRRADMKSLEAKLYAELGKRDQDTIRHERRLIEYLAIGGGGDSSYPPGRRLLKDNPRRDAHRYGGHSIDYEDDECSDGSESSRRYPRRLLLDSIPDSPRRASSRNRRKGECP
jgi:hypothetical protein